MISFTRNTVLGVLGITCVCVLIVLYAYALAPSIQHNQLQQQNDLDEVVTVELAKRLQNVVNKISVLTNGLKTRMPYGEYSSLLLHLNHTFPNLSYNFGKPNKPAKNVRNKDICQEKYAYDKLSGDFPYFYKGFNVVKCSGTPAFHTLLTLVYNCVHYSSDDLAIVDKLLTNVNRVYPNINVLAALPLISTLNRSQFNNTKLYKFNTSAVETDIWSALISKVTTKYVYIGRNVVHFTWFDRLERLVREINNINAYVVASASRTLHSGKWSHGCEQSILRNYTLVYRHGYALSKEECMLCHHVHGPFVAKTELFKKLPLEPAMSGISGFAVWFFKLTDNNKLVVACPDSMSFVSDESRMPTTKQQWTDLANYMQVEKIYASNGSTLEFDCVEAGTSCAFSSGTGLVLSHCCMNETATVVKLVITYCKEKGFLCELQGDTLLGAVRFGGLPPWTVDTGVVLYSENFTAFTEQIGPVMKKLGYTWKVYSSDKYVTIGRLDWFIKVTTTSTMDTERLIRHGINSTKLDFKGIYVPVPENPGIAARRFVEQTDPHLRQYNSSSQGHQQSLYQLAGTFLSCSKPGHHACLDRFITDGNLQFAEPVF